MKGKHSAERSVIKINYLKTLAVLFLIVLLSLLCFVEESYGKYVINKEIVLNVSTADYYFTTKATQTEFVSSERNNSIYRH